MPLLLFITAVLGTTLVHAAASNPCSGPDWATPVNTVLLIGLAFIQHRHYQTASTVHKIVDRTFGRRGQEVPPPDNEWKRESDPPDAQEGNK